MRAAVSTAPDVVEVAAVEDPAPGIVMDAIGVSVATDDGPTRTARAGTLPQFGVAPESG